MAINAGRDLPDDSPFSRHVNGYLLENVLGVWGLGDVEAGLRSALRARTWTRPPHLVVFAVDTDDTGVIDRARLRTGRVASLLLDTTYSAFDSGSREHGGVSGWWFSEYDDVSLGEPAGPYVEAGGVYRRDFTRGSVIAASDSAAAVTFASAHRDVISDSVGVRFTVAASGARIFLREH